MAKLTQKQIDATAALWKDADDNRRFAETNNVDTLEYFRGKKFAVSETFAAIMGFDWATADDMLRKRARALA